jgi:hypothetical protein
MVFSTAGGRSDVIANWNHRPREDAMQRVVDAVRALNKVLCDEELAQALADLDAITKETE